MVLFSILSDFEINEEQVAVVEASVTSKQSNQNTTKRKNVAATEVKQAEKLPKKLEVDGTFRLNSQQ